MGLFRGPQFCSSICVHLPLSHCLDYSSYIVSLNIRQSNSSHFIFVKIVLATSVLSRIHINFRINLSMMKNPAEIILIGIALSLQINLGRIDIIVLILMTHECSISLHLFRSCLISAMLCSFQYTDFPQLLLDLLLSFYYFLMLNSI